MRIYVIVNDGGRCHHFDERTAEEAVKRIMYIGKDGVEHHGEHWSVGEVREASKSMSFKECVTDWDKYVAFNSMYADLCRVLSDEQIVKAAHAFYFADEDAPCGKVWRYIQAMRE